MCEKIGVQDVIVRFPKPPPREVTLKGERWTIAIIAMIKSGKKVALIATCANDHREHTLCTGRPGTIGETMAKGFLVRSGTPQRGLVTALRQAGIVTLAANVLPDPDAPEF